MKGKYITTQILLACLSKPVTVKKEEPATVQKNSLMPSDGKTSTSKSRKAA